MNVVIWQLSPSLRFGANASLVKFVLILWELTQETLPHLQILSSWVEELQSLQKTPSVSSHYEGSDHKTSSVLSFDWLHQYRLLIVYCFLHELVDLIRYFLLSIKESLLLVILPVKSQVENSNRFPVIGELSACSIDDSCDFVGDDKL